MEEQGVILLCTLDKPPHPFDDVGFGRKGSRIVAIIREQDHVFRWIFESIYLISFSIETVNLEADL